MPNRSKQKGTRFEREVADLLSDMGLGPTKLVPRSGACAGYEGDVRATLDAHYDLTVECKVRAEGFKNLYQWLGDDNEMLVIKADRKAPLFIMGEGMVRRLIWQVANVKANYVERKSL